MYLPEDLFSLPRAGRGREKTTERRKIKHENEDRQTETDKETERQTAPLHCLQQIVKDKRKKID